MSLREFKQEISKGLPFPVYLFHSTEEFLLYEALSVIRNASEVSAFNFDVYDLKSADGALPVEQLTDVLNTLPFLSGRKTIVLKNMQKFPKKDLKKLEGYLNNPSGTSLLIMFYLGKSPKIFDPATQKNVKTISLNLREDDIPLWIKEKAGEKGIRFSDKAVAYLIYTTGTDLGMLYAEIEKFSSMDIPKRGSGVIDVEDIKGAVYSGVEYDAFDLVDALNKKDAKEVFRIFEKAERNMEPQMLLGALNWQYSNRFAKAQKREERKSLEVFGRLHEADIAIKTSHGYAVELLLLELLRLS